MFALCVGECGHAYGTVHLEVRGNFVESVFQ